jgi:hypothetical protein
VSIFGKRPKGYDTRLDPKQEADFARWSQSLPPNLRGTADYDLRGAFQGKVDPVKGHLPDTWKKPNHITFSNESQYSSPDTPGGQWVNSPSGWVFWASPHNMKTSGAKTLMDYFRQNEPDSSVILPINYSLPRR